MHTPYTNIGNGPSLKAAINAVKIRPKKTVADYTRKQQAGVSLTELAKIAKEVLVANSPEHRVAWKNAMRAEAQEQMQVDIDNGTLNQIIISSNELVPQHDCVSFLRNNSVRSNASYAILMEELYLA